MPVEANLSTSVPPATTNSTNAPCATSRASARNPYGTAVLAQVLLNESRTQVNVDLHQRRVADAAKSVDLAGLDDENVAGAGLELLAVDGPEPPPLPEKLDFIVRMAMRAGARPGRALRRKTETLTSPLSAPTNWWELP